MDNQQAKALLEKYRKGLCSPEEEHLLDAAFNKMPRLNSRQYSEEEYSRWLATMWERLEKETAGEHLLGEQQAAKEQYIRAEQSTGTPFFLHWKRYAAVMALLIAMTTAVYFYFSQPAYKTQTATIGNIVPGGNKATLTLADGQKINLSSKKEGIISRPEGLVYNDGSKVELNAKNRPEGQSTQYLLVTTPNGGQYQVRLPDGTKVWLNSASTLRYPQSFAALSERRVTLSGEGYFEVAEDPSKPFKVVAGAQEVEVLGTHFNINAYLDEPVEKTTLLEGRLRVTKTGGEAAHVLVPGQQAVLEGESFVVRKTTVEDAIAWKNGDIVFDGAGLEAIMRQISRWYDVEVEYRGHIPQVGFSGSVSRERPIEEVLKALEASQSVHFEIEGKRVVVIK